MTNAPKPYMLRRDEGQPIWFLGTLMLLKATGQQNEGQFSLIEQVLPPGFSPPLHVHHGEDEAFYILEGTFRFMCGDTQWDISAGDFVFLPKEIPHSFLVTSNDAARLLQLTAPAGLEHFHVEAGDPAESLRLPQPAPPDIERVLRAGEKYNFEIVGPPMGES